MNRFFINNLRFKYYHDDNIITLADDNILAVSGVSSVISPITPTLIPPIVPLQVYKRCSH